MVATNLFYLSIKFLFNYLFAIVIKSNLYLIGLSNLMLYNNIFIPPKYLTLLSYKKLIIISVFLYLYLLFILLDVFLNYLIGRYNLSFSK